MLIMRNPDSLARAGGLSAKAQAMHITANWAARLGEKMQTASYIASASIRY
jgi:hypothetical protein